MEMIQVEKIKAGLLKQMKEVEAGKIGFLDAICQWIEESVEFGASPEELDLIMRSNLSASSYQKLSVGIIWSFVLSCLWRYPVGLCNAG